MTTAAAARQDEHYEEFRRLQKENEELKVIAKQYAMLTNPIYVVEPCRIDTSDLEHIQARGAIVRMRHFASGHGPAMYRVGTMQSDREIWREYAKAAIDSSLFDKSWDQHEHAVKFLTIFANAMLEAEKKRWNEEGKEGVKELTHFTCHVCGSKILNDPLVRCEAVCIKCHRTMCIACSTDYDEAIHGPVPQPAILTQGFSKGAICAKCAGEKD